MNFRQNIIVGYLPIAKYKFSRYTVIMTNKQPPNEIKIFISDLMKQRNIRPMDLVRNVGISNGTAYKLADPKKTTWVTEITFRNLVRLCKYFNVPLSEIIQYDPNSVDSG